MARYLFEVGGDHEHSEAELPNDAAAWAALVTWSGEFLKEFEGRLPPHAEIELIVREDDRRVATLRILADRVGFRPG